LFYCIFSADKSYILIEFFDRFNFNEEGSHSFHLKAYKNVYSQGLLENWEVQVEKVKEMTAQI
jgi:hypothetical protein